MKQKRSISFKYVKNYCYFIAIVSIVACNSKGDNPVSQIFKKSIFSEQQVVDFMSKDLNRDYTGDYTSLPVSRNDTILDRFVDQVYASRFELGKGLIWLGEKEPNIALSEFEKMADSIRFHGLDPEKYFDPKDSSLTGVLQAYSTSTSLSDDKIAIVERKLTRNFISMIGDLLYGQTNPRQFFTHKFWSASNDSSLSVQNILDNLNTKDVYLTLMDTLTPSHEWYGRLVDHMKNLQNTLKIDTLGELSISKYLVPGDHSEEIIPIARRLSYILGKNYTDTTLYSSSVSEMVKTFKRMHRRDVNDTITKEFVKDLNASIQEQISRLNKDFERWHWGKKEYSNEYILVNIPEYRLYVYKNDSVEMHMNCVVGKTSRQTPTIDAKMTDLVINPTWTVPPTILKKDILPSIKSRGGYAVTRKGLTAYDSRGRKVNPSLINSSNYKRFRYVQKPSYNNSLGTVKFNMPNRELVYLHDTNHRWGFNSKTRARSSGCVRVQHPRDMASLLLAPQEIDREMIDSMIKKGNTLSIKLERELYAHFVYLTTGIDSSGGLVYYPDIYKYNEAFERRDTL